MQSLLRPSERLTSQQRQATIAQRSERAWTRGTNAESVGKGEPVQLEGAARLANAAAAAERKRKEKEKEDAASQRRLAREHREDRALAKERDPEPRKKPRTSRANMTLQEHYAETARTYYANDSPEKEVINSEVPAGINVEEASFLGWSEFVMTTLSSGATGSGLGIAGSRGRYTRRNKEFS